MSQTPNFSSDSQLGQMRAGMHACFLDLRHFFVLTFYNTTPGYESKLLQGQGFVVLSWSEKSRFMPPRLSSLSQSCRLGDALAD
jgi:hypothetical protein